MKPLATFNVRVFFLFSLWGSALNAQTISLEPEKDLAGTVLTSSPFYPAGNNFSTSISDSLTDNYLHQPIPGTANSNEVPVEDESTDFFCPLPPVITSFSPETGTVGTTVIINGSGFDPVPSNNIVYFGATRAVVSAATATTLTVTVPFGATYQFITVTTPCNLTGFSLKPFVTTFPCGGFINPTGSFAGRQDFPTGVFPYSVTIGDLDGDGKPDVTVALENTNQISVLRNLSSSGSISFAAGVNFPTGSSPRYISSGDIDGDGKMDLVIANFAAGISSVSVFINSSTPGSISFAPRVDLLAGDGPISIAINDIDRDGKPDLAVANFNSSTISILANNSLPGFVSFSPAVNYPTAGGPRSISLYDINLDSRPDLVIANENAGTVSIVRNNSTPGTISFTAGLDIATGSSPHHLSIGDLDGDGKPEIAVANVGATFPFNAGSVTIIRNTSFSGFLSVAPNFTINFTNPFRIVMGDLDGDGKPDLVVKNYNNNTLALFRNTCTSGTLSFATNVNIVTLNNTESLAIGDLDGDGKPDIALSDRGWDVVTVFRNTIAILVTPAVSITASPSTVCTGNPVTFTATPTNGGPAPIYQWQVNGVNAGTNSPVFSSSTLANGDVVKVIMTSSATCPLPASVTSNTVVVAVGPPLTPSLTLAANQPLTICAGTSVTYTATASNTSTGTVTYNFFVNGSPVQSGPLNNYTSSTLANGAVVSCTIAVAGGTCLTANTASSNTITMTVNPNFTPAVMLAVNPSGPVCANTPVTFTATATGTGTGTVTYNFFVNGSQVQSSPANSYTSSSLNNSDVVSCTITVAGGTCLTTNTAASGTIPMQVNPNLTPAVTIAASPAGAVCASSLVTFTATASNTGTGTITYTFSVNGNPQQISPSNVFTTAALANGNTVTCAISISGGTCLTTNTAVSNIIPMQVNPNLTPTLVLAANPAGPVCAGTPITFTATASGTGTGTLLYTFFVNGNPVQSNSTNTFTSTALTNGNTVSCTVSVSGGTCLTSNSATSNTIPVSIAATVVPAVTISTPATTVCAGSAVTFTATPANGGGSPAYQWQVNGVNTGTNAPVFTTSTISSGDQVSVILTSSLACASPATASSNTVTLTVTTNLTPGLALAVSPAGPVCANTPVTFTATPANTGAGTVSYTFYVDGNPVQTGAANSFTTSTLANGQGVSCTISISGGNCLTSNTAASNTITMAVNPNLSPTLLLAASVSGPVCAGTPVTFTATAASTGTGTLTYTFLINGSPVQSSATNSFTSSTFANNDIVSCVITISGGTCLTSNTAASNTIPVNVNPNQTPAVAITVSPAGPVCASTAVTFTATATNSGTGSINYTFLVNGTPVQSSAVNSFTSSSLVNGDIISCSISITGGTCLTSNTAVSNTITMAVNPNLTPTVVLAASPAGPVCAGTSIIFTATPANTGTGTLTYSFFVDGNPVQSGAADTYTSSTLANGNTVTCSISIAGGNCLTANSAVSNAVQAIISATVVPAVSISTPSSTVCAGTPVTFTATPTNGGTSPVYQWQVNGINTGPNAASFTSNTFANGDQVRVVITTNLACASPATATSNTLVLTVNPTFTPALTLVAAPAGPVCANTPVTFTATPANTGTGTVTYTFYIDGNPVQSSAVATFTSTTLTNGAIVSCTISISGGNCLTANTAASNTITMAVNPNLSPALSLAVSPAGPVCAATPVTFTATASNSGTGTLTYTFSVNGNPVQSSSSNTFSSATLANGNTVSCSIAISGGTCLTSNTATSNTITMAVNPNLSPALTLAVSPSGPVCASTPVTFTATANNTGAGTVTYTFYADGNLVQSGTANSFTSSVLTNGTIISCSITISGATCLTSNTAASNPITMVVNPGLTPTVALVASPAGPVCAGTPIRFTATAANTSSGTVSYTFLVNGNPVQSSAASSFTSSSLANGDIVTCSITISGGTCLTANTVVSNPVPVTISSTVAPAVIITTPSTTVCAGAPVTFIASPTNGGTSPAYQWQINGVNVGSNSASLTTRSLASGDQVNVILTTNLACAAPATAVSNIITMTLNPVLTPSVQLAVSSGVICSGDAVTFTATPVNGGNSPSYQWQLNGVNTGSNSRYFTSSSLSNGDQVKVIMNHTLPCVNSTQVSATIPVLIDPQQCPKGFYIPNGFTPNRDGKNDLFKPLLFGKVVLYRFSIYNRWGQKVFESTDVQKGWDGKVGSKDTDSNVFIWVCTYRFEGQSIENRKGTVALIR